MNLHNDKNQFSIILRATSQYLGIKLEFVEKDYWITLVLKRLSMSSFVNESVFKGGTSLSKGFNLIDRFSEDIDIAIINKFNKSGNQIKTIIRSIEKEITSDLFELIIDGVTSKGSRFRKSVFEYVSSDKSNHNNKLIIEVNSFANPIPFQKLIIKSFVFDFLNQTGNERYINQYNLQIFEINVLNMEQTLLEKLVSLIRFSLDEFPLESISSKIRHFYDLYYLLSNSKCREFISTEEFKEKFDTIFQQDREMFNEPKGWQNKSLVESPLINDFDNMWIQLKVKYQTELSALAFRKIPNEANIAESFRELIKRINL